MKTIYLCGPISGQTDEQCRVWRSRAATKLSPYFSVLDPMRRDYRGREQGNAATIVNLDLVDVRSSDVLLVNANKPGWGTAMEVKEAFDGRKCLVVAFCEGEPSPWVVMHTHYIAKSLDDAIHFILLP